MRTSDVNMDFFLCIALTLDSRMVYVGEFLECVCMHDDILRRDVQRKVANVWVTMNTKWSCPKWHADADGKEPVVKKDFKSDFNGQDTPRNATSEKVLGGEAARSKWCSACVIDRSINRIVYVPPVIGGLLACTNNYVNSTYSTGDTKK
jgi:hypothetical protein